MSDGYGLGMIELIGRRAHELVKAGEKYGEAGLLPGGDPELDVLDYAINEVAGLRRYGEMIRERAKEWPPVMRQRAMGIGYALMEVSDTLGKDLCSLWLALRSQEVQLGREETRSPHP